MEGGDHMQIKEAKGGFKLIRLLSDAKIYPSYRHFNAALDDDHGFPIQQLFTTKVSDTGSPDPILWPPMGDDQYLQTVPPIFCNLSPYSILRAQKESFCGS